DGEQPLVLEPHVQFGQRPRRVQVELAPGPRQLDHHDLALEHLPRRPRRAPLELDLVALDQLLELGARPPRAALGEESIEPHPVLVLRPFEAQPRPQRERPVGLGIAGKVGRTDVALALHAGAGGTTSAASRLRKLSRFSGSSGAQRFCPTRCCTTLPWKTTLVTWRPSRPKKWTRLAGPSTTTVSSCTSHRSSASAAARASSNALWVRRAPWRARSCAWPVRRPCIRVRCSRSRLASRRRFATRFVRRSSATPTPGTREPPRPEKTAISRRRWRSASGRPSRIVSSIGATPLDDETLACVPPPPAPLLALAPDADPARSGTRPIAFRPRRAPSGAFSVRRTCTVSAISSPRSWPRRSGCHRSSGRAGACWFGSRGTK